MNKKIKYLALLFILFLLLYLLPQFFSLTTNSPYFSRMLLPEAHGGDSPHYLLVLASLIDDFDFDLHNNHYYSQYPDAEHASIPKIRGYFLDHSTTFVHKTNKSQKVSWSAEAYTLENDRFVLSDYGKQFNFNNFYEYEDHPIGLPLFAAYFLWPLRRSHYIETGAIILTVLSAFIGFCYLYKTLRHFQQQNALFITILFAFTTALWPYSRTFFTEPYLWVLLIIALYYTFVKEKPGIAGISLTFAFLMKYIFMFPILIIAFYLFFTKKKRKPILLFLIPPFIGGLFLFFLNYALYGNPFYMPIPYTYVGYQGIISLFFSIRYGILPFTPILLFSFLGVWQFYQLHKKETLIMLLISASLMLFLGMSSGAMGALQYSGRYAVIILPLFAFPLQLWYNTNQHHTLRILFYFFCILSFLITLYAFLFPGDWESPPWKFLYLFI